MKRSRGVILPMALSFMGLFTMIGLGALQMATSLGQSSVQYVSSTQAFWLAEAGAVQAREALKTQVRTTLSNALNTTAAATVVAQCTSYQSAQDPLAILSAYGGFTGGSGMVTLANAMTISLGSGQQGTYAATVTVVADPAHNGNNPALIAGDYIFYYKYSMTAVGRVDHTSSVRSLKLGDATFTVDVQKENFARYGVFTSTQVFESGGDPVWFTSSTHYTGPIHTNDRFNFAGIPGGTFDGSVAQSQTTARFYNNGSNVLLDCDQNPCASSALVNAVAWRNTTTYTINDYVTYNAVIYRGLQTGNVNRQPDTQAAYWRPQFLAWDNTFTYAVNDNVVYNLVTYRCSVANTNRQPDTQTGYWQYAQGTDVPRFNQGFLRGQAVVNLPTDGTTEASSKIEASGTAWNNSTGYIVDNTVSFNADVYRAVSNNSNSRPNTGNKWTNANGVYVPNVGGAVTGGIYVKGNACMTLGVTNSNPVYSIRVGGTPNSVFACQGGTLTTVTVDNTAGTTTVAGGTTKTYSGIPDGMTQTGGTLIYDAGTITGFAGTVERDTVLTVTAENDIVISGHVRYEADPRLAGNANAPNLLGLIAWTGDIRVATTAPNDLVIQGVLMAPAGNGLYVDNYNSGSLRGTIQLLGGLISQTYGVVGTFSSGGGSSTGYGRDFTYDARMSNGAQPLYYPYTGQYMATDQSNGSTGLDAAPSWQES